jgi:hypothetical protein
MAQKTTPKVPRSLSLFLMTLAEKAEDPLDDLEVISPEEAFYLQGASPMEIAEAAERGLQEMGVHQEAVEALKRMPESEAREMTFREFLADRAL